MWPTGSLVPTTPAAFWPYSPSGLMVKKPLVLWFSGLQLPRGTRLEARLPA